LGTVVTLVLLLRPTMKVFAGAFWRRWKTASGNRLAHGLGARLQPSAVEPEHGPLQRSGSRQEPDPNQPLLAVDHLQVGLTIDSLLSRKWHVRTSLSITPVARMALNRRREQPPNRKVMHEQQQTDVFDLAIRELRLI